MVVGSSPTKDQNGMLQDLSGDHSAGKNGEETGNLGVEAKGSPRIPRPHSFSGFLTRWTSQRSAVQWVKTFDPLELAPSAQTG